MSPNNILPTTINVLADLFIGQSMSPNVTRVHDRCPVGQLYLDLDSERAHRLLLIHNFVLVLGQWHDHKLNNCNCICTLTWIQIMPTACYWFIIVLVLELYLYLAYGTILHVWSKMFLHPKLYWQFLLHLCLDLDLLSLKLIYIRGGA